MPNDPAVPVSRTERAAFRSAERAMAAVFPCTPDREREIRMELTDIAIARARLRELANVAAYRQNRAKLDRAPWPDDPTEGDQIERAIALLDERSYALTKEIGAAMYGMWRDLWILREREQHEQWMAAIDCGEVQGCPGCGVLKAVPAECKVCDLSINLVPARA